MANENDGREYEEILESLQSEERSFDDFLNRRAQKVCEPVAPSKLRESLAPDVVEESKNDSSIKEDETKESEPIHAAQNVDVKALKIEKHTHPIVGTYVSEQHVTIEIDEEWQQVFTEEFDKGVAEMSAEEIIERRHKLDRAITLLRARDQGLQLALEEVLRSRNSKDRAALMEMQAQLRAQRSKRVVTKKISQSKKAAASKPSVVSTKSGPKGVKAAKTFISLGYDKEGVINSIKEAGLLDDATLAFIEKSFS